jgi:hypothetical protein
MEGVRPFLVRLNQFVGGPKTAYNWDKQQPISEDLRHVLGFLYQQLPLRQAEGAELWPMQPCTVYYWWMRGLIVPYDDLVVTTWDAARSGIALAVAVEPGVVLRLEGMKFEGVSTIVTFEDTPEAQAHREAAGAPMAMRLLRWILDMRGRSALQCNDCLPVIYALEKGSNSPQLQPAAEAVCREALEAGVLYMHVPGEQLIAEWH